MKVKVLEEKIICQNRYSRHNYFAWPSVARLQDGRLAMVCSGFRLQHICPFGKSIIQYSSDEGKTWSVPGIVIDTMMDDRDSGICTFGEKGVIVTSFNNTFAFQREQNPDNAYIQEYCNFMEPLGQEKKYCGSTFVMSNDGGVTFGDIKLCPVTSPHGPLELPDGKLFYVGTQVREENGVKAWYIDCYTIDREGNCEFFSSVGTSGDYRNFCEPHAVLLKNGKMIVHIRVESYHAEDGPITFTVFQAESHDLGKTWTKPHQLLPITGGSPAHLLELSDGTLVSTYGHRNNPFGVRAMISTDSGETWETEIPIYEEDHNADVGYPCSVELENGDILTVYYTHPQRNTPAVIMQTIWRIEK